MAMIAVRQRATRKRDGNRTALTHELAESNPFVGAGQLLMKSQVQR